MQLLQHIQIVSIKQYEVKSVGLVTPLLAALVAVIVISYFGRMDLKRKQHALHLVRQSKIQNDGFSS